MDKYKYSYLDEKGIYCYKNSDVLINKLNIQDEETFVKAERLYSGLRQSELLNKPINGDLDFKHLKQFIFIYFKICFTGLAKLEPSLLQKVICSAYHNILILTQKIFSLI
jgi:hypothetical protein